MKSEFEPQISLPEDATCLPNFPNAICPFCGQDYWLGERCYSQKQALNCEEYKQRFTSAKAQEPT
ncbi:hypothetical protein ACE1CD_00075 [Aerosakkonema sp. BLCC-F183]|uniref:hypothetical protein n=1 Tax=Aerosakkonema sp. BLCC-F183 TaxID=3342834 RepID=UPI0035B7F780